MYNTYRSIEAIDVETGENLDNVLLASNEKLYIAGIKKKQKEFLNNKDDFKNNVKILVVMFI